MIFNYKWLGSNSKSAFVSTRVNGPAVGELLKSVSLFLKRTPIPTTTTTKTTTPTPAIKKKERPRPLSELVEVKMFVSG